MIGFQSGSGDSSSTRTRRSAASDRSRLRSAKLVSVLGLAWLACEEPRTGTGSTTKGVAGFAAPGTHPADVDFGVNFGCAIRPSDGAIACWGNNSTGQLGIGSTGGYRATATQVGSALDYTALTAGGRHACAIRAGQLWCWGDNNHGQLGIGSTVRQASPVRVGAASNWTAVAAGLEHTCGVRSSSVAPGQLFCFGNNRYGQLGDGTTSDRTVPVQIAASGDWLAAGAGQYHSCAISRSAATAGRLYCFGQNNYGQLGNGSVSQKNTPTLAGTAKYAAIDLGSSHSCGVSTTGDLLCFGLNSSGQLGDGTTSTRKSAVRIGSVGAWAKVSAGVTHTCAIAKTGGLFCFGDNGGGQLGVGDDPVSSTIPLTVGSATWSDVGAGTGTCGFHRDALDCFGPDNFGELGTGQVPGRKTPAQSGSLRTWRVLAAGQTHACGIDLNGALWCWGQNTNGQLGLGHLANRDNPTRVGTTSDWIAITAGTSHSCGLRTDLSLWCWGLGSSGQLGNGSSAQRTTPVQVIGTWRALGAGALHTCAIDTGGDLYCFGRNAYGQLGDGTVAAKLSPVRVGGGGYRAVAGGLEHTCAISSSNQLVCFGRNNYGQLGVGSMTNRSTPGIVPGGYLEVATGNEHTCAIAVGGGLYCFGHSNYYQTGNGATTTRTSPVRIGNGTAWSHPSARGEHSCAVYGGALYCWGRNGSGQIGDGGTSNRSRPFAVPGLGPVAAIAAGGAFTCAIRPDPDLGQSLWCWGDDSVGQLADGATFGSTPVDECALRLDDCAGDATCIDTPDGFTCACHPGFTGDGRSCADVDECVEENGGCDPNATCSNRPGTRLCACNSGWVGDGVSCSDVDECLTGNGGCDPHADCTNSPGAFSCTCKPGWDGDGFSCPDVDECYLGTAACDPNADCTNLVGGYDCRCRPGYEGDGNSCTEIDECQRRTASCDPNAECINSPGSFACACRFGYTGDGFACADVDECATHPCAANAMCVNSPGSYACECLPGYEGDGYSSCLEVCGNGILTTGELCDDGNLTPDDGCEADCTITDCSSPAYTARVTPAGIQRYQDPDISADGRFVAFSSEAADLVPGDTNERGDVFVIDRQLGVIERVSVRDGGEEPNESSDLPAISADGNFVVFQSSASNLGSNGNVFLRDRAAGTTTALPIWTGSQIKIDAGAAEVAFLTATALVPEDTNGRSDCYLYDRKTDHVERLSVASDGTQADGDCFPTSISPDGRFVAFVSNSTTLSPLISGSRGPWNLFLRDLWTKATTLISVSADGSRAVGGAGWASLSAGGRFIAFDSSSDDLVAGDANSRRDIFVRDLQTGLTELISAGTGSGSDLGVETGPDISADGRFVIYQSSSTNLVVGDNDQRTDLFVFDRDHRTTYRVDRPAPYVLFAAGQTPALSADGRYLVFMGNDHYLADDYYREVQVFVHRLARDVCPEPKILAVTPRSLGPGSTVEIQGYGFAGTSSTSVSFDGIKGSVGALGPSHLRVTTPAISSGGSVVVTVDGVESAPWSYTVCGGSILDCDGNPLNGCETHIDTDPLSCGGCGRACPSVPNGSPGCSAESCGLGACDPGFDDCNGDANDGCETPVTSDPDNCGGCGVVCPAVPHGTTACAGAACVVGTCAPDFGDCDSEFMNGCETVLMNNGSNCGTCGNVCALPDRCAIDRCCSGPIWTCF